MNRLDTFHLFTIPKWLPSNTLLPELWAIIFHWKWRLELKDIHKQLPDNSHTIDEHDHDQFQQKEGI